MADSVRLAREPIDLASLLASDPQAGALCLFVGMVRDHDDGRPVRGLDYEGYEEMALPVMREIVAEARRRHGVSEVRLVHRLGSLEVGAASVALAVLAAHREEAFAACRFVIDELKRRVPIWKKQHYDLGSAWLGGATAAPDEPA